MTPCLFWNASSRSGLPVTAMKGTAYEPCEHWPLQEILKSLASVHAPAQPVTMAWTCRGCSEHPSQHHLHRQAAIQTTTNNYKLHIKMVTAREDSRPRILFIGASHFRSTRSWLCICISICCIFSAYLIRQDRPSSSLPMGVLVGTSTFTLLGSESVPSFNRSHPRAFQHLLQGYMLYPSPASINQGLVSHR